ncbi:MAG: phosphotransferase [Planctomycetaceae bacterium]|nr:phosphotransferase [Planctomycetaceae bacterium]
MPSHFQDVFTHFSDTCRPRKVLELENFAGWGGRVCYRVVAEEGRVFCLRRWPEGQPPRQHLELIQAVLWMSDCAGTDWLPLPFETNEGKGYVERNGFVWELLPWFSGYKIPFVEPIRPGQLVSLVEALADFHCAVESFPLATPAKGISPLARARNRQWQHWIREKFARLDTALSHSILLHVERLPAHSGFRTTEIEAIRDEMIEQAKVFLRSAFDQAGRLISILARASRIAVPHQPVLQSLYRRHLVFSDRSKNEMGRHLSGLVDCSGMSVDTPAVDMAMVLAHIAPWESAESIQALARYRKIRDIPDNEYYLMVALYHAETVLSPLDKLAKLFLPNEPGYLAAPNVAQIAAMRDELHWALGQIANFQKDE